VSARLLRGGWFDREDALVRWLSRGTAEIDRPLWTGRHNDRPASYFLMTAVRGHAQLSGPEARANRPDNSFQLCWVTADEFAGLGLFPPDVRGPLAALLAEVSVPETLRSPADLLIRG
jgi:hypothetical protein